MERKSVKREEANGLGTPSARAVSALRSVPVLTISRMRLKLGKDAFHRVPDFGRNEWDAVERVLTILEGRFMGRGWPRDAIGAGRGGFSIRSCATHNKRNAPLYLHRTYTVRD